MENPVEVDETFAGGTEGNKHAHLKLHAGRGSVGKVPIAGIKDRSTNEIRAEVVQDITKQTLQGFIHENVIPDAVSS